MTGVLLVAMEGEGVVAMANLLRTAGHAVFVALGFKEATTLLAASSPDVLISTIRLGDYNGLHLVLRSRATHPAMRAILLDRSYDPLTESEAKRFGAQYDVEPINGETLLAHVSRALTPPARRWPRKKATDDMLAQVEQQSGRVIDISYGGLRFELPPISEVPAQFDVTLPGAGLVFQAKPVWTRRVASGWVSCGAELLNPNPQAVDSWRRFVDAVPDRA